jgi:vanillate O-demethylase ferredoxin subunit
MLDRVLTVRVDRIRRLTPEVAAFEFVHPWGGTLPAYRAGAHIDVHLPGGFMRPYSLARAPEGESATRYVVGVKREPCSRGGSASMHERVRVGDLLAIGTPRNTFPLRAEAAHHLLLAGGIGLTPLLAMAQQLARDGGAFTLCAFARSRAHLAFADDLAALAPHVRVHLDDPAAPEKLDLAELLAHHVAGTHLYLCGPAGFMQAALAHAARWPDDAVHLEYFAPPASATDAGNDEPFVLRLARRGIDVPVAADQTAVEALHDLGIDVPTSCEQGVCGTCVVGWRAGGGEPDHRDHCLSSSERRGKVALCCSRAKSGALVIDL